MVLVSALLWFDLKDDVLAKCLLLVTLEVQKTEQPSTIEDCQIVEKRDLLQVNLIQPK